MALGWTSSLYGRSWFHLASRGPPFGRVPWRSCSNSESHPQLGSPLPSNALPQTGGMGCIPASSTLNHGSRCWRGRAASLGGESNHFLSPSDWMERTPLVRGEEACLSCRLPVTCAFQVCITSASLLGVQLPWGYALSSSQLQELEALCGSAGVILGLGISCSMGQVF